MADELSFDTAQPTLSERVQSFLGDLDTIMSKSSVDDWSAKLSGTFESLDLDLVRKETKSRHSSVGFRKFDNTLIEAPTELRPAHGLRVRLLARMVIKALDSGEAERLKLGANVSRSWERDLTLSNTSCRKGPPLDNGQLGLLVKACAAVFQHPAPLPDDAYNLIADYLIAKLGHDGNRQASA